MAEENYSENSMTFTIS